MEFQIDLDPAHGVIRLTVISAVVDLRCAEEVYARLKRITSDGFQYAGIYDLSAVTGTTLSADLVRSYARRPPSIPLGRTHVVVGKEPHIRIRSDIPNVPGVPRRKIRRRPLIAG